MLIEKEGKCYGKSSRLRLALYSPVVTVRAPRFNIHKLYVLPTQRVYVFCVDSDYLPIQH
jgi:hypothetical protein